MPKIVLNLKKKSQKISFFSDGRMFEVKKKKKFDKNLNIDPN